MAEFLLGRIKFVWKGDWASSTAYVKDDVIRYGGKVYICTAPHTSDTSDFYLDSDNWNIFTDGSTWKDDWTTSTYYKLGDIVKYGGYLYIANNAHTSADTVTKGLEFNQADWDIYSEFLEYRNDWAVNTRYRVNDIVKYGGTVYVCIDDHTSSATAETDIDGLESDNNGKVLTFDSVSAADASRAAGTYSVTTTTNNNGSGVTANVTVDGIGGVAITLTANGQGYAVGDIITIADADLGAGGAPDVTFTVVSVADRWNIFSEGFDWKNEWTAATRYKRNDLVRYGGQLYVCRLGHKSGTLSDGLEADQSKWEYFHKGVVYRSAWASGTRYRVNDLVQYGANIYICTTHHTATNFISDESNWENFVPGLEFEDSWNIGTTYQPGDLVTYGGYSYIAKTNNVGKAPYSNANDWGLYLKGLNFRGDWGDDSSAQDYLVGDVVRVGGYTYMCIQDHQNQSPPNATYWVRLNQGIEWNGDWSNITQYDLGDVVYFGVNSYLCVQAHQSDQAIAQNRPDQDTQGDYWAILAGGNEQSALTTDGDLVYYSGSGPTRLPIGETGQVLSVGTAGLPAWQYWGRTDHVYYVGPNGNDGDYPGYGSTLDRPFKTIRRACEAIEKGSLNPNAVDALKKNRQFIQREVVEWVDYQIANVISPFTGAFTYDQALCYRDMGHLVDAVVYDLSHGGNEKTRLVAYNYFDKDGASYVNGQVSETVAAINYAITVMDAVISSVDPATNYQTENGYTPAIIQIKPGNTEEANAQSIVESLVEIVTDAITAGGTSDIPAEEAVQKTIFVKTGTFYEILPIIVPKLTAVVGDELRSTVVQPSTPDQYTQRSDIDYSVAAITRVKSLVSDIVQGSGVTKTGTNTQTQSTAGPVATATEGTELEGKLQHLIDYINYYAGNDTQDSTAPTMSDGQQSLTITNITKADPAVVTTSVAHGLYDRQQVHIKNVNGMTEVNSRVFWVDKIDATTFALYEDLYLRTSHDSSNHNDYSSGGTIYYNGDRESQDQNVHNAVRQLYINREFLAEEATAYITATYPSYTYNVDSCKRDVREYIDALIWDLTYGGTYRTTMNGRWYVNAVEGSLTEDMFYLRDGTGLRNCSVKGLTGTLSADNAYGTKRPTAGAFVSLDPGWGPADNRTWISTRSPYVQNVSTFGTACVGLKVDGSLHDSGNDSIVANDFTQIISDGIGAWITNLGRAELVSVFSYYGHIGYLAENGGKIRATNGNSSYGTFGCVAEGVDATEKPITGTVNNRFRDAVVGEVLTDQNQVLTMFYDNAGINYEKATFTVAGDGASASVIGDEIRDQALFNVRMLNTDVNGDGVGDYGGADYGFANNTAQFGDQTSIRISNTDTANSGDYDGMRIVITSGLGVGQYAYIGQFNAGNKDATVFRESDDEPGWDHFVPGTPIAELLDGTTKYIIEPRVTINEPPFSSTSQSYGTAIQSEPNSIAFGNDRFIIVGSNTTTSLYSTDGVTWAAGGNLPSTEQWTGLTYGGGDDSTEEWICTAYNTNGGAYSTDDGATWSAMTLPATANWVDTAFGNLRYVAIAEGSTSAAYSDDGITWTAAVLPSTQNWKKVIYGKQFLAISDNANYATSIDGSTWNSRALPSFTDTDTNVKDIAYGNGRYIIIGDKGTEAFYSTDGINWTTTTVDTTADSSIGGGDGLIAYGSGIFLWTASKNGQVRTIDDTSFSGADALRPANTYTDVTQDSTTGSGTGATFDITVDGTGAITEVVPVLLGESYTVGDTITIADASLGGGGGANFTFDIQTIHDSSQTAISSDGIKWNAKTNGKTDAKYSAMAFGRPYVSANSAHRPTWFAIQSGSNTGSIIRAGARAFVRARVATGKIPGMRIWEPGSGYSSPPTITITDPSNTVEAPVQLRIGDGVLGNPTIINAGTGYETAQATISGNGTADEYQPGANIFVKELSEIPRAGSNVEFDNLPGSYFKLVTVRELTGPDAKGQYACKLQVSPDIPVDTAPPNGDPIDMRIRYSQVRLTGHDFLDIGTGNFTNTNYPNLPLQDPDPAKETVVGGGGRVFFTSTDQDGNFRVGDLFSVEQSTGVATLDADAFNIAGLNELSLGSVELGGTGAVITEFSTDGTFAADSDSIVPTQRAIRTFINAQIGGGNSELNVNILTAGVIEIKEDQIDTTTGVQINVKQKMNFTGGIDGDAVALQRFLLS